MSEQCTAQVEHSRWWNMRYRFVHVRVDRCTRPARYLIEYEGKRKRVSRKVCGVHARAEVRFCDRMGYKYSRTELGGNDDVES